MKNSFLNFLGMFNIFPLMCGVKSVCLKLQVNICALIGRKTPVARKVFSPRILLYLSNFANPGMSPSRAGKNKSLNNKTTPTMKNQFFSFPFPVILCLLSLFPSTSYSSTFMEIYLCLISTNSSATGSLNGDITRFNLCSKCFSYIRFPGLQSRAYSFPKVCMWEIDPATRDCRPICKIGWDIVLIKTC